VQIVGGAHFPWIEQPRKVGAALDAFAEAIAARR
jgi:pimeloyl-ACP methyl ester carboxylesterase